MRSHSTTSHPATYLRLFALAILSVAMAVEIPHFGGPGMDAFFSFTAVNIGILYAITVGFLMSIAINRKLTMDAAIALELNKVRRLHHLALHLNKVTKGSATWFKSVDKAILAYLKAFKNRDFLDYDQGDKFARDITYAIYSLPQVTDEYNDELYGELLSAAASFTEARETIRSNKDASIGYFQWIVTIGMTLLFAFISVAATPFGEVPRILTGAVIFNLFVMLQLIYEYDQTNGKKRRVYTGAYLENAKRLS